MRRVWLCSSVALSAIFLMLCPSTKASAETLPPELRKREEARIAMLERIAPAVVCVMAADGNGGGSGVLISPDGYAISNYHVTSGSGAFLKCGLNDGKLYDAVLVGIDPTGDVALIRLLGRTDFPCAVPGDSDRVQVGDEVVALGNPFLLAGDFTPTVTFGIVSGIHRYQYPAGTFLEYTDCIQIDASINPGNSGGPLFDIEGRWIGINGRASFEKRGRVNAGAAYAISVRQVLLFVDHLKCGLIADHGITDFTVTTASAGRTLVSEVSEVSEAYRRGLRPQAELLSFAGRSISSANDFQNILGIFPEGTRLPLTWRDREGIHEATIRLRPLHAFQKAPQLPQERQQPPVPGTPEQPQESVEQPSAELQALFEERDGFANFHFNRLRQDELLGRLKSDLQGPDSSPQTWELTLSAEDGGGGPGVAAAVMELVVAEAGAGLSAGGVDWYQAADDLKLDQEPRQFPGLLAATVQWHRLFSMFGEGFDEVTAHGQLVHLPSQRPGRILLTIRGTCTSRWYFAPDEAFPFAADVEFAQGEDEVRLMFREWIQQDGFSRPSAVGLVSPETEKVGWLKVESFRQRRSSARQANVLADPRQPVFVAHQRKPGGLR